jgi:hypothetical protein
MVKELKVSFIPGVSGGFSLSELSLFLNGQPRHAIDNLLWDATGYFPEVGFALAYTDDSILLKYFVKEKYVRAFYREANDPVFNDTCVEFFIALNGDTKYYNLEFNCAGTTSIAYGADRHNRIDVPANFVKKIKTSSNIQASANNELISWELTLQIPFEVFNHHHINSLKNEVCRANFYKCGDELPEPHFMSWNNVISPQPNFHLSAFFGNVKFQ